MERPRWLRIHLPIQETRVQSLDQEDPLEKEVVTHSSILAWRILWTEEPGGLWTQGRKEPDTTERLTLSLFTLSITDFYKTLPSP